jgi:hypothetical protein
MKKIIFFILLLVSVIARAQPSTVPGYNTYNEKRNQLALIARALNIPTGTTPALKSGQPGLAGALFLDSTGGNKGLHGYWDGVWHRFVDTTWSSLVTTRDRFGFSGEDVRGTASRTFSFANNAFKLDSLGDGTRFVSIPKTLGGRAMSLVTTNGTDSAFVKVSGDLTTGFRTLLLQANKTSLSNTAFLQIRGGSPTDIFLNVHGLTSNESVIGMDSSVVQIYRRVNGSIVQAAAATYLYDD